MNPGMRILPLPSVNGLLGGEWASRFKGKFLSLGWEIIIEGGWTTNCQHNEDVERTRECYHIINFPEMTWNVTLKKKRSNEHHSDGTLPQHSLLHRLLGLLKSSLPIGWYSKACHRMLCTFILNILVCDSHFDLYLVIFPVMLFNF